jgi:hypothetical protein
MSDKPEDILTNKDLRKLAALETQKAKEKIFKLVVKIISWESGSSGSAAVQSADKITEEEWQRYKKHRLNTFNALDKDKAKEELNESYNSIKANNGFA